MRLTAILALLAFAGCGDKAPSPGAAPATKAAAASQAPVETAEALKLQFEAQAKVEITAENAEKAADELLKEIEAEAP